MAKEEFDHNAGALCIDGQLYRLAKINRNGDRELFHIVKTKNGELVLHPVEIGIRCGMTPHFLGRSAFCYEGYGYNCPR